MKVSENLLTVEALNNSSLEAISREHWAIYEQLVILEGAGVGSGYADMFEEQIIFAKLDLLKALKYLYGQLPGLTLCQALNTSDIKEKETLLLEAEEQATQSNFAYDLIDIFSSIADFYMIDNPELHKAESYLNKYKTLAMAYDSVHENSNKDVKMLSLYESQFQALERLKAKVK